MDDLWQAFWFQIGPIEKVGRTIAVYLGIVILVRLAGKRLMAQMNSLDLVVVLLLSNVVQNAIIGDDLSIGGALLGAAVLVGANALLDHLCQRVQWLHRLFIGRPTTIVADGKILDGALDRLGMTRLELSNVLRNQGADDVTEVHLAQLAPGGSVVVDVKHDEQNVSLKDLHAAVEEIKRYLATR